MGELPIFDSLTHPTPNGDWLEPRHAGQAAATVLVEQMRSARVRRVLAVGMGATVGGYDEATYADWVRASVPGALPIAFVEFDGHDPRPFDDDLRRLASLGYVGVKVHPRRSGITFADPRLGDLLRAAAAQGLVVLICSFSAGHPDADSGLLGPAALMAAIDAAPGVRVVVLHGGTTDLLRWAEWVRPRPGVLLDLSFTILRYRGSSVDLDIAHLFDALDQRLCIGSDFPQFDLMSTRERVEHFARTVPRDKAENIAHHNLDALFAGADDVAV